jgi:hypothetical protein
MGVVVQADGVEERQDKKQGVHYGDMSTAEAWLRQAQHLTSVAVTEAASVKAFLGRWKAIENRLLQLPALLTEMSHLHCLSHNKVCKELLQVTHFLRVWRLCFFYWLSFVLKLGCC